MSASRGEVWWGHYAINRGDTVYMMDAGGSFIANVPMREYQEYHGEYLFEQNMKFSDPAMYDQLFDGIMERIFVGQSEPDPFENLEETW